MRGGVAGWDPRRPCGSTTGGGLTSRDVGRPGPLRAPAVGDPATTGLSAPVARDATLGANRRARVRRMAPMAGHTQARTTAGGSCQDRSSAGNGYALGRISSLSAKETSCQVAPKCRGPGGAPPVLTGVAEALFHASSGLARAALAHGATAGTAASSSGWSTTLSCSLGSVRAPITMTGSVWLRLTAMCEMPAGI
jgi:hypothetical protein